MIAREQAADALNLTRTLLRKADGTILYVSDGFCRLYEFAPEELLGKISHEVLHSEFPAPLAQLNAVLERDGQWSGEIRHMCRDGQVKWVASHWSLTANEQDGTPVVIETNNDISEQKRIERRLRESEELFSSLFQSLPSGCVVISPEDGSVLRFNQTACAMLGYTAEQFARALLMDFEGTELPEVTLSRLRSFTKVPDVNHFTTELLTRTGGRRRVEVAARRIETDGDFQILAIWHDVTERTRAEEARKEIADRLSLAINATQIGTFDFNLVTGGMVWSDVAKRHFGIPTDAQVDYETFLRGTHPEDRERVHEAFQKTILGDGESSFSEEYRSVGLLDGLERWIAASGRVLYESKGRPQRFVGVISDVTERKRAEQLLRFQLSLNEGITSNAPDGIFVLDPEGRVMFTNPSAERLLGWSRAELDGRILHDVVHFRHSDGRAFPAEECPIRRTYNGGHDLRNYEARLIHRDGRSVPVTCSTAAIFEGGKLVFTLQFYHDLTTRKATEVALLESEARFRRLVEADIVGIVTADANQVYEANDYFLEMVGYTRTDLETGAVLWDKMRLPEYHAADQRALNQLLSVGACTAYEKEYLRKDGKRIPVLMGAVSLRSGEDPRFLCFFVDQTERKHLEEQFRRAQKLESIGQLAGGIAHDFNNLLTIITGYSHMSMEGLAPTSSLYGPLEEISKAGARAATLTRQLLLFSRRQNAEAKNLSLNEVINGIEKMLRRLINEDIQLVLSLEKSLGLIRAETGQIEQVIVNLAVNARDAMPQGGRLVIETSSLVVDEEFAGAHFSVAPGVYAMMTVSDTGMGMSQEVKSRIFEPFFTTKEPGKGTGLGLSTVYGIVHQSRGAISVYSEPDEGTTFKVFFPVVSGEADIPAPVVVEGGLTGTETILLAEDEPGVREFIRQVLARNGYQVLQASNGKEALQVAEAHRGPIHLLLSDVVMPQMGGGELADRFAATRPEVPVICMSGYTDRAWRRPVNAKGFIQKPFSPTVLLKQIRVLLDTGAVEPVHG